MKRLPVIPEHGIANEVLQPYFQAIEEEVRCTPKESRKHVFLAYLDYLEREARAETRKALRMQIRINLASLKNKLFPQGNPIPVRRLVKAPRTFLWDDDTPELEYEV